MQQQQQNPETHSEITLLKEQFDAFRKHTGDARTGYPRELKEQAVNLFKSGKNAREIVQICGVAKSSILNWKNEIAISIPKPRALSIVSSDTQSNPDKLAIFYQVKLPNGTKISIPHKTPLRDIVLALKEF